MKNTGETIFKVGELIEILKGFDENDDVVIETIDLETGDSEDLYPFCIDVVEGVQMEDKTTIREIRFLQQTQKHFNL